MHADRLVRAKNGSPSVDRHDEGPRDAGNHARHFGLAVPSAEEDSLSSAEGVHWDRLGSLSIGIDEQMFSAVSGADVKVDSTYLLATVESIRERRLLVERLVPILPHRKNCGALNVDPYVVLDQALLSEVSS